MVNETPLVSVWMTTYNHERYIAQAIESVLMQKTNFSFELLIGEDCSTDSTGKICRDYAEKYPGIIRLFSREKNLGMMENGHRTLKEARGKYIAILEGDDLWIQDTKLQKQVDFLEANPDYVLCAGYANVLDESSAGNASPASEKRLPRTVSFEDLLVENGLVTLTVVFRNVYDYEELIALLKSGPVGDWPLYIYLGLKQGGKYFVMPETFGIYRIHTGGVYSLLNRKQTFRKLFHTLHLIGCLTRDKYSHLLLLGTIIHYRQTNATIDFKALLIDKVQESALDRQTKTLLVDYIQSSKKNSPAFIFSSEPGSEGGFAIISGFLLADAYLSSDGNFLLFTRWANRIVQVVSSLNSSHENFIRNFVRKRWFGAYIFFDYGLMQVMQVYPNKHLLGGDVRFLDWLYFNKEKYPVLSFLSNVKKKLGYSRD